jgi:hypothetical protein
LIIWLAVVLVWGWHYGSGCAVRAASQPPGVAATPPAARGTGRAAQASRATPQARSTTVTLTPPMNVLTNARMAEKEQAGINVHLYSDDHPDTTTPGTGFKDAAAAHRTLRLIAGKPRNRQVWTVNAMLNRAKHHPSQTAGMRAAMEIYQRWMADYRAEKQRKPLTTSADHPVVAQRQRLEGEYKRFFNVELPAAAKAGGWPVYLNHCLMRVALDGYWQCCWYKKLDQKVGALKSMSVPQIENVLAIGQRMLQEGLPYVVELNQRSLGYRGKLKRKAIALGVGSSGQKNSKVAKCGASTAARSPAAAVNVAVTESDGVQLLQLEPAKSGRARCKGCSELIAKGEWRVGLPAWVGGRKVVIWQHPGCALTESVCFERAPNAMARCKVTGHRFSKGEPRGCLLANGSKSYYQLRELSTMLQPVMGLVLSSQVKGGDRWQVDQARGLAQLDPEAKAMVYEAFCHTQRN